MPFSGNEMFFSEQQAIDFARSVTLRCAGSAGFPTWGPGISTVSEWGHQSAWLLLEAKKARFADAKKETEKSAAPKQTKKNGNKFAGLMVDSESDSEDEPSTPPVKVESKVFKFEGEARCEEGGSEGEEGSEPRWSLLCRRRW